MEIIIYGEVTDHKKNKHEILITEADIESIITNKAKEMNIKGYSGNIFTHLDERVVKVNIID